MRKIFLYMTMTFDGFVAGPNNDLDWFTPLVSRFSRAWGSSA